MVIIPPASNIQKDDSEVDITLVQRGDHPAYDDVQLLNAMTGRVPTSFKLHIIREDWDALIRHDLDKTRAGRTATCPGYPGSSGHQRLEAPEERS